MNYLTQNDRDHLLYAFGHLVSSYEAGDAHAGDSGELALDTLEDSGFSEREIEIIDCLTEHVYGNYEYTGKAADILRRIKAGEL